MRGNFVHAILFLMIVGIFGCGQTSEKKSAGPQAPATQTTTGTSTTIPGTTPSSLPNTASSSTTPPSDARVQLALSKFKTTVDFDASIFPGDECKTLVANLKNSPKQVPDELKLFLAKELAASPILDRLSPSFLGYYFDDLDPGLYGVTCPDTSLKKAFIIFSYSSFVEDRQKKGLPMNAFGHYVDQNGDQLTDHDDTDSAIITLIHESLHAIDFSTYNVVAGADSINYTSEREQWIDFSWKDYNNDKFDMMKNMKADSVSRPTTTLNLTRAASHLYAMRSRAKPFGFHLANKTYTSQDYINDYDFMKKKTNFIAFYAATNPDEDFAETLAQYYMYQHYKVWPTDHVYTSTTHKTPIYTYDPSTSVASGGMAHDKVCTMAKAVLGLPCP